MYEYRLDGRYQQNDDDDVFVICKVIKREKGENNSDVMDYDVRQ